VVDSDAHPSLIGGNIVNTVWSHLAKLLVLEVVHIDLDRTAFWLPFPALVEEVADQFLLLGVDADHRITSTQIAPDLPVEVVELRVSFRMVTSLLGLSCGLEAVVQILQHCGYGAGTNRMPGGSELCRKS